MSGDFGSLTIGYGQGYASKGRGALAVLQLITNKGMHQRSRGALAALNLVCTRACGRPTIDFEQKYVSKELGDFGSPTCIFEQGYASSESGPSAALQLFRNTGMHQRSRRPVLSTDGRSCASAWRRQLWPSLLWCRPAHLSKLL